MSTSRSRKRKSAYHHGDLRRVLVAAAERLVEREGAAAVSLRAVARRAGVSHNAPYRHFASRAALLRAVAAAGFAALGERLAAVPATDDAPARLSALGKAYVDFALEHGALYRLMFGGEIDSAGDAALAEAAGRAFDMLRQAVAALRPEPPPREAAVAAWAFVHGIAGLALDRRLAADLDRDRLVDIGTRIFGAGLESGSIAYR